MHRVHLNQNLRAPHVDFLVPELQKLYWSQGFSSFASGLVAIFIPIFFLKIGYSLPSVLGYMALYGLFCVPMLYIALNLLSKIGANRMMAIGSINLAAFLILLITLPTYNWPLAALAAVAAWVNSAYWPSFHANFAAARTPSKSGRQLSYIYALIAVAGALAPAIGGILATAFDIKLVYLIAALIFTLAALPLLVGVKGFRQRDFNLKRLKDTNIKSDLSAYSGWSIVETAEQVIWPIIIFFIVSSYASIGILSAVVVATGILTTLYVGRRLESKGEKHYMKQGSATISITNFGRSFTGGVSGVFSMNLLSGISFHLLSVSLFTRFYRHVARGHTLEYLFIMESIYGITLAAFYSLLIVLTTILPAKAVLITGLLLTIPASYFTTRMR